MRAIHTCALLVALALGSCARFEPTEELVVPLDERPAVTSRVTPPPISGGTLAVVGDGVAVAADPDRDRVMLVDVAGGGTVREVALEPGDEPGRVVAGSDGLAHVVLRGADAVVTIDTTSGTVVARRETCREPRGVAHDPVSDALHVACASGALITFTGDETTPSGIVDVGPDARDVVLADGRLYVTRFKSADLLLVTDGAVASFATPISLSRPVLLPDASMREIHLSPSVAWRAVPLDGGRVVMVHQRGQDDEVVLTEPTVSQPSSYGGASVSSTGCGGIVESTVTMFEPSGHVVPGLGLVGSVLPVDIAASAESGLIAIANAGPRDPEMPRPSVVFHGPHGDEPVAFDSAPSGSSSVALMRIDELGGGAGGGCIPPIGTFEVPEPVTAVAFMSGGSQLLAQTREPARLYVIEPRSGGVLGVIELGGESRADTGHDLFHRDTGSGIACASCHPEGAEDGRVWTFSRLGPRRSQALDVGLAGTAPFHWDGELRDLGHLMEEVFVGRMGGVHQSGARLGALEGFLFGLESKGAIRDASDLLVVEGRAVFERAGCADCHAGAALTTNETVDVGTGGAFQVPSLVGIGYRAPFLHDGCAPTLRDRFDPSCGGSAHGSSALSDGEVESLVAYLESL